MRVPKPEQTPAQALATRVYEDVDWQIGATIGGIVTGMGGLISGIFLLPGGNNGAGHPWLAAVAFALPVLDLALWVATGVLRRRGAVYVPGYVLCNRRGDGWDTHTSPADGVHAYRQLRGVLRDAAEPVYVAMLRACAVYEAHETPDNGDPVRERVDRLKELHEEQRRIDAVIVAADTDVEDLERIDAFLHELRALTRPPEPAALPAPPRRRRFRQTG